MAYQPQLKANRIWDCLFNWKLKVHLVLFLKTVVDLDLDLDFVDFRGSLNYCLLLEERNRHHHLPMIVGEIGNSASIKYGMVRSYST